MDLDTILSRAPEASEYASYYGKYITLIDQRNIRDTLESQFRETQVVLSALTEEQGGHRYAPGKWSIREVVGHINDSERIFAYRALRIARGDQTPIEGFDQDAYVEGGWFERVRLAGLAAEFASIRQATLSLLRTFDAEAWTRRGIANKNEVSVRALAWIIAGHERHHRNILAERYLS